MATSDRLPPNNIEAEQGVLGSMILDNEVIPEVLALLKPEDFFRDTHMLLFAEMKALFEKGSAVDTVTLAAHLTQIGKFKVIGGDDALFQIVQSVPHAANAVYYAQIVLAKSGLRAMIGATTQILRDIYSEKFTVQELSTRGIEAFKGAQHAPTCGGLKVVGGMMDEVQDKYEQRKRGDITGIRSGYTLLDGMTDGFQPEELTVLAGRPSMGKSALAMNLCEYVSITKREPSLFVSLEMSDLAIAERCLVSRARIDGQLIRQGRPLSPEDDRRVQQAMREIRESPLFLIDKVPSNYLNIAQVIRESHAKHGIKLAAVDYLQLMTIAGSKANQTEQLDLMTLAMKNVARECKIPVILLSQLNRGLESRTDKRPIMSDLRGSGAIEQHADLVLFLYRPEYYNPQDSPGVAELIVGKNRTGPTGIVNLAYQKQSTRFDNLGQDDPNRPVTTKPHEAPFPPRQPMQRPQRVRQYDDNSGEF